MMSLIQILLREFLLHPLPLGKQLAGQVLLSSTIIILHSKPVLMLTLRRCRCRQSTFGEQLSVMQQPTQPCMSYLLCSLLPTGDSD